MGIGVSEPTASLLAATITLSIGGKSSYNSGRKRKAVIFSELLCHSLHLGKIAWRAEQEGEECYEKSRI